MNKLAVLLTCFNRKDKTIASLTALYKAHDEFSDGWEMSIYLTDGQKYLVSSKVLDFKTIRSFGRSLKPHEDNVLQSIEGKELFLYDTTIEAKNPNISDFERKIVYNYKQIPFKWTRKLFLVQARQKFNNLLTRITKKR